MTTALASVICVICMLLIPLAAVGLALVNAGLGRSRAAAHTMIASLCVFSVAVIMYFICGFGFQGFAGAPSHVLNAGGKQWDWIGAGPFFLRRFELDGSFGSLVAVFSMLCAGLAALIPLGAAAERWRLRAMCASTALLAGFTFPLFNHWARVGWLEQVGINYGLGHGFIDVGGSSWIHAVGGLTALSIVWILGPRRGKYSSTKMPNAIPAHSAVLSSIWSHALLGRMAGSKFGGSNSVWRSGSRTDLAGDRQYYFGRGGCRLVSVDSDRPAIWQARCFSDLQWMDWRFGSQQRGLLVH